MGEKRKFFAERNTVQREKHVEGADTYTHVVNWNEYTLVDGGIILSQEFERHVDARWFSKDAKATEPQIIDVDTIDVSDLNQAVPILQEMER